MYVFCKILKDWFSFYEFFNGVNEDVKYRFIRINIYFFLIFDLFIFDW